MQLTLIFKLRCLSRVMIRVAGLTKYYSGKPAAKEITFSVEKGEVFGLLGLNPSLLLENNYEKSIKLIDANFTIKNLFDEKLFAAKILRSAYVEPERIKDFAAVMDKTFDIGDSCGKLEQSDIEDYKIDFSVDKIAFEDNSIINFK